jgi:hypothetical protein
MQPDQQISMQDGYGSHKSARSTGPWLLQEQGLGKNEQQFASNKKKRVQIAVLYDLK